MKQAERQRHFTFMEVESKQSESVGTHPVSPTSSTDSPNRSARPTSTASRLMA